MVRALPEVLVVEAARRALVVRLAAAPVREVPPEASVRAVPAAPVAPEVLAQTARQGSPRWERHRDTPVAMVVRVARAVPRERVGSGAVVGRAAMAVPAVGVEMGAPISAQRASTAVPVVSVVMRVPVVRRVAARAPAVWRVVQVPVVRAEPGALAALGRTVWCFSRRAPRDTPVAMVARVVRVVPRGWVVFAVMAVLGVTAG